MQTVIIITIRPITRREQFKITSIYRMTVPINLLANGFAVSELLHLNFERHQS